MMSQAGFFDLDERDQELSVGGDPLVRLNAVIEWKSLLPLLKRAFEQERKRAAGRKPYARLVMLKVLVLQGFYYLSDHQLEFEYEIKSALRRI